MGMTDLASRRPADIEVHHSTEKEESLQARRYRLSPMRACSHQHIGYSPAHQGGIHMPKSNCALLALLMLAITLAASTAFADMAPGPRCGCQLARAEFSLGATSVFGALLAVIRWRRR